MGRAKGGRRAYGGMTLDRNEDVVWDVAGNLLSLTDPVDNTTTWVYDDLNRMIEETNELSDRRRKGEAVLFTGGSTEGGEMSPIEP